METLLQTILIILVAGVFFILGKEIGHRNGFTEYEKEDTEIENYYKSQIKLLEQSNEYLERKLNECYKSA